MSIKGINKTHGFSGTRTYICWKAMRYRAKAKKRKSYIHVEVCERWNTFEKFLEDMGECPSNKHSIERKNNAKGYEPSNCKWATNQEQSLNRSVTDWIEFNGVTKHLSGWARDLGINRLVLFMRINRLGWSVERAFTTPVQSQKRKKHHGT